MKPVTLIIPILFAGCPCVVSEPRFDCTQVPPENQQAFDTTIARCEDTASSPRKCGKRARKAYCKHMGAAPSETK